MQLLHDWFLENKRDFPWRDEPNPYAVWVSEVMLQQTRASVVIPYFSRWMEKFPDVKSLASAPLEAVIKCWEGLGYYSRVRNLHAAARQIVEQFDGKVPQTKEELLTLKGLGTYTVGAILSFGFHQKAAAVDGNVFRVLSRYFQIEENICSSKVKKKIENLAEEMLDPKTPWITAEALIELGATICTPTPRCEICPLQKKCLAFQSGRAIYLPIKNPPPKTIHLERIVPVIVSLGKVLLKKGEAGKIMADLYEFPYFERDSEIPWKLGSFIPLVQVEHTFTRYKARLHPRLFRLEKQEEMRGFCWVHLEELSQLPFSSGHKKIVKQLLCGSYI